MSARLTTAEAAAAWFYPDRQRCLGCRRYFAGLVIKRLYCTYECAGMEPPPLDPRLRPRSCRTAAGEAKKVFLYPGEVVSPQSDRRGTIHVYLCDCCGMYHIGHKNPNDDSQVGELPMPPTRGRRQPRSRR